MSTQSPIVEMHGISIQFLSVKALDGVDFRLLPGEVHALMGENGAGKSTLIKALTGVNRIDEGHIVVDGEERLLSGTSDAQRAGIAVVYQEVNLCSNLSIGENVMLGQELRGRFGIDWKATHSAAKLALDKLGLGHLDPRRPLSTISLAVQQLVAISRSMVGESKVLILDEPTSSLDANEVSQLFDVIRRLRSEGVAILFVSHFLDQVYEISDRITVLRNGRSEGEYLTADLDRSTLISKMIGKELDALKSIDANRRQREVDSNRQPILSAVELERHGAIEPMDVLLHRNEVIGLAGLLGSGRSELARLLCGADRPDGGSIELHGTHVVLKSPAAGLENGIVYSSEDRREEGIIGDLSVRENIILALQARRGWLRPLSRHEQDSLVSRSIKELGVRPNDPEILIKNLSGGNQQKVLLARWLATRPEVLLLDEPTRGIDVGAKAEIQSLVAALSDEGAAVVFISSELDEVVRLSDRVIVLKDHRKVADLAVTADTTTHTIIRLIAEESAP